MLNIRQNIELSPYSSFNIGGRAKYFTEISSRDELAEAIKWSEDNKVPYLILGGGSNIVINSSDIYALVVRMSNKDMAFKGERIECGAGLELSQAVNRAAGQGLSGLEWAIGIPGSIGGAVRGNAGAYGSSVSESIEMVEAYKLLNRKFEFMSNRDCLFGYRDSIFKNKNLIIWQVSLKLHYQDAAIIKEKMAQNAGRRNEKLPKLPSAGSIFKNITWDYLQECNPGLAESAASSGAVKGGMVASAWVIDRLGLKGKVIGGAKISLEHANFIVNTGRATAENVITLISYIKQQARDRMGIQLNEEVQYFGFY